MVVWRGRRRWFDKFRDAIDYVKNNTRDEERWDTGLIIELDGDEFVTIHKINWCWLDSWILSEVNI